MGHIYRYYIKAVNPVGSSASSSIVTVPFVVPATPTGLQAAIKTGPARVTLSWTDASTNELSFGVWRSDNNAGYVQIGTVARTAAQSAATGGAVTFDNTNTASTPLALGHTYSYYVTAINILGPSAASNKANVTYSAPIATSGLNGVAVRIPGNNVNNLATLNWADNSNNEVSFQIQRATTSNFAAPTAFTVGAGVVTLSQNVVRTSDFYYRVRAVNPIGNSGWSNTVFVTTP